MAAKGARFAIDVRVDVYATGNRQLAVVAVVLFRRCGLHT